jgi:RNA-dependent RNA polymerase
MYSDNNRLCQHGTRDESCLKLAKLCSQAVDYPKNGIPVDLENDKLPSTLIRCKPDWQSAEVETPRGTDYYESSRALGYLYRAITITDTAIIPSDEVVDLSKDPISLALKPHVERQICPYVEPDVIPLDSQEMFHRYTDELRYICATHTLSNMPGIRLLEEEIVVGTILAKCSQKRWRNDRIYRMRLHTSVLVQNIRSELLEKPDSASIEELRGGLAKAWRAWDLSVRNKTEFGAGSFGLIALGVIFDCLDRLRDSDIPMKNSVNILTLPCFPQYSHSFADEYVS